VSIEKEYKRFKDWNFLKGPGELGKLDEEICAECKATTLNEYKEGQKFIWNELPGLIQIHVSYGL
jgi:hypothetical protein